MRRNVGNRLNILEQFRPKKIIFFELISFGEFTRFFALRNFTTCRFSLKFCMDDGLKAGVGEVKIFEVLVHQNFMFLQQQKNKVEGSKNA